MFASKVLLASIVSALSLGLVLAEMGEPDASSNKRSLLGVRHWMTQAGLEVRSSLARAHAAPHGYLYRKRGDHLLDLREGQRRTWNHRRQVDPAQVRHNAADPGVLLGRVDRTDRLAQLEHGRRLFC